VKGEKDAVCDADASLARLRGEGTGCPIRT